MPELKNMRYEVFARSIVTGLTTRAAYSAAGYVVKNMHVADANGARLLRNAAIKDRIAELRAELIPALDAAMHLDAAFVTTRLMAIAQGKVPEGDVEFDTPNTTSVTNRITALSKLGEVLGIFKAPAVADAETASRALAKQMNIPIDEARARIAEAERFAREHA